jgi:hypothetical protein
MHRCRQSTVPPSLLVYCRVELRSETSRRQRRLVQRSISHALPLWSTSGCTAMPRRQVHLRLEFRRPLQARPSARCIVDSSARGSSWPHRPMICRRPRAPGGVARPLHSSKSLCVGLVGYASIASRIVLALQFPTRVGQLVTLVLQFCNNVNEVEDSPRYQLSVPNLCTASISLPSNLLSHLSPAFC